MLDEEADIARLDESKQAELRVINESRTHETEVTSYRLNKSTPASFPSNLLQWKQLTECSTLPNPKLESEINTYLFLLADDSIIGENGPTLKLLVQQIPDADNVNP